MKKLAKTLLITLLLLSGFLLVMPSRVAAADYFNFDDLNPFYLDGSPEARQLGDSFKTPAGVINRVLFFIFPIAGLLLFVMIVWGGFEMLMGAANSKSKDAGRQRITAAIIGFVLLFSAYWITQIVEIVFRVNIL
jgi:hypothetical protein